MFSGCFSFCPEIRCGLVQLLCNFIFLLGEYGRDVVIGLGKVLLIEVGIDIRSGAVILMTDDALHDQRIHVGFPAHGDVVVTVCLDVDDLVNEENFDTFTTLYTMAHQAPADEANPDAASEITALESALLLVPDELPEHQADEAERFIVTIPEDGSQPVSAYDANAHLVPYRHYVLAASYAGDGHYMVAQLDVEQ